MRIFTANEAPSEDPYNTFIQVASNAGVAISPDEIKCLSWSAKQECTAPIVAKFVRREVQSAIKRGKTLLKQKKRVYRNDDETPSAPSYLKCFETCGTKSMYTIWMNQQQYIKKTMTT